jgi:hypothetical protein
MNPLVAKAMQSIRKAYKADRDHLVRLDRDFYVGTFADVFPYGENDLPVLDFRCRDFSIVDRQLTLYASQEAKSDGATLAPDKVTGVDLAAGYLPHDYLYGHLDEMANDPAWKAAGWTKDALRALFDSVLGKMIEREEKAKGRIPWISRLYYGAVRVFGGLAHKIGIHCLAILFALGVAGCVFPDSFTPSDEKPDYTVVPRDAASSQDPATPSTEESGNGGDAAESGSSDDPATGGSGSDAGASSGVAGSSSSVVLDFRFGGFRGGKAVEDSRCRISKLKVGKDSLSINWGTKIPDDWARDKGEKGPLIVVAAFYKSGDAWIGGKFDWIDESRSSRSLENIKGGYGGWDGAAFTSAKTHAVCVVSADGRFRSNLIED